MHDNTLRDRQKQLGFSEIFGLTIFNGKKEELLSWLMGFFEPKNTSSRSQLDKTRLLFTPNAEQIVLSRENPQFLTFLQQADILIPDGAGLVIVSKIVNFFSNKLSRKSLTERIAGADLITEVLQNLTNSGEKVFVIGGRDYDQLPLSQNWQAKQDAYFEGSLVVRQKSQHEEAISFFWTEGYKNIEQPTTEEEAKISRQLKQLKPGLVLVAFGAPNQERWLIEHRDQLSAVGVKLGMAVGGSIDFLLGKVKRAPVWMQKLGLEWLFRLMVQPWRWQRQLRLFRFLGWVIKEICR